VRVCVYVCVCAFAYTFYTSSCKIMQVNGEHRIGVYAREAIPEVCCTVLLCVALCCCVLRYVAVCRILVKPYLLCVAVRCHVLQCVAVC